MSEEYYFSSYEVVKIIRAWNGLGGTIDYVGNQQRKFLGVEGLIRLVNEFSEADKIIMDYTPTYMERRLTE